MRAAATLAATLALLAALLPVAASGQFDPTGETVVVEVLSTPQGAGIEFKGYKQKYKTNIHVSFEKDFLRTIRLTLDGYEPCTATQDQLPRDPETGDLVFVCELVRIDNRFTDAVDWLPWLGPVGPLYLEDDAPEIGFGPIASDVR